MQKVPPIVIVITRLYDHASQELRNALASGSVSLSDERIKNKVVWLREVATTLTAVYQLEKLRTKDAQPTEMKLPEEQLVKDPALEAARKKTFQPPNTAGDLSGFHSPGGWQP